MSKSFVELNDVKLRYSEGDELALETTNMKIDKGEFIAVVGPSGCGKSSLLKLVSGLMPPSEGNVIVDGKEVSGPLKIVGMAFQNPTLLPWRTTLDNVLLPMEIVKPHRHRLRKHRAEYEERARKLLATVGLEGHENKYPWELSGGMQQRASLCRSLIHEPDLLMLDEPFGALDAFTREELWDILQNLWMIKPFTVILVTHDLREAAYLADTIYVMSKRPGKILVERENTLPRPRDQETTFTQPFTDLVHELRGHIRDVRES
ncbi:nitrate ABC transporter ATP-binding protein [Thalassospira sp. HJ]|uniref:ABC transporter ATP-binding protein n=1 Tax=unclassified Thalassospira TaxID=2648997 RepID=UPI0005CF1687|nr:MULTISPECIES: ABC transporter ATP-binding protein [unclassified Thalassospira]KJE35027.1 nitrate ABC transporter ATP-binding protein [Thalassospira sp. HJ]MBC07223.1 ABC transporter ATP-binding protein [Thalassospira sp.]